MPHHFPVSLRPGFCGAVCAVLAAALTLGVLADPATARRAATVSESAQMWRAADPADRCPVHRRGKISTVSTGRVVYGSVTIADRVCGNGMKVLRKRRGATGWVQVLGGSDQRDWCISRRGVPLAVLRDLTGDRNLCG